MAKQLSASAIDSLRQQLEEERDRLVRLLSVHELEREEARLSEGSADRSPDPANAEAGAIAFEFEKELSIDQNSVDLLGKVEDALDRMDRSVYGTCESCGAEIPLARLEALPYTALCVTCAQRR